MSDLEPIRQAPEDVQLRFLVRVGVFCVVVAVLAVLLVFLVLRARGDVGQGRSLSAPRERVGLLLQSPIEPPRNPGRPPEPRVPAELESYGWVDRDAGIARIPIERAMEIVAERGR